MNHTMRYDSHGSKGPKRMTVAVEGADNPINNYVILPGALHVEEEEIPVVWNNDHHRIIGKARRLERDGNEVTMEIELFDSVYGLDLDDHIGGFVYVQPFEAKKNSLVKGAISEVTKGRIRSVCLQDLMPEAVRKDV